MKLNLKQLAQEPGAVLPFSFQMELSGLEWNGAQPFARPVQVEGRVRNMAGAMLLTARMTTVLSLSCDRCAKPFEREKTVEYETLLAFELEDEENDDILLLDGTELDLDEAAGTAFILAMDTKNLCSDDCKGLCAKCGADLNLGPCGCRPDVDPRLAALAQLLDKEAE